MKLSDSRVYESQMRARMQAHIKHEKEELKSLNVVFERNKQDSEQRYPPRPLMA